MAATPTISGLADRDAKPFERSLRAISAALAGGIIAIVPRWFSDAGDFSPLDIVHFSGALRNGGNVAFTFLEKEIRRFKRNGLFYGSYFKAWFLEKKSEK